MMFPDSDVGGAKVVRPFLRNGERLAAGHQMSADEFLAIPFANRRALVDSNYVVVSPKAISLPDAQKYIVHRGGGHFDVIAGQKLNTQPLSKDEAEDLATRPN